jgi:hypothetical protein
MTDSVPVQDLVDEFAKALTDATARKSSDRRRELLRIIRLATPPATEFSPAEELVDELSLALKEAKGIPFETAVTYAEPIVRYLQQQYGATELYIPQPYVRRDVSDIIAARNGGTPLKQILRDFNISRRTYYRLLSQA